MERLIMAAYRPLLKPLGLTYSQYLVLLVLWEKTECSVGELCAALKLDTGTLSPLLKRMGKKGLVSRKRRDADERGVHVALTKAGMELESRAVSIPRKLLSCVGLNIDDYHALSKNMRTLIASVETNGRFLAAVRPMDTNKR